MSQRAKVTYKDGRVEEIAIGPRAIVAVEAKFPTAFTGTEPTSIMTKNYYMCWAALHFAGLESETDFDKFLDSIDDAETWDDDEAADPTPRARKPAKSSRSA